MWRNLLLLLQYNDMIASVLRFVIRHRTDFWTHVSWMGDKRRIHSLTYLWNGCGADNALRWRSTAKTCLNKFMCVGIEAFRSPLSTPLFHFHNTHHITDHVHSQHDSVTSYYKAAILYLIVYFSFSRCFALLCSAAIIWKHTNFCLSVSRHTFIVYCVWKSASSWVGG